MTHRTFLITGASKGIGRAASERLAGLGHTVVGMARDASDGTFPGTLVSADLTDRRSTQDAVNRLMDRFDFDGVVKNVGFVKLAPFGEIDLDDVGSGFRNNLVSTAQISQALLPGMRQRGFGRIVNLSSLVVLGVPQRSVYAAAKSAMISFTRTWAVELAPTGVTVNSVAPGPTATELFQANSPVGSEAERKFLSLVPMQRLGKPSELAAAIAYFLSDDAGFVTGQTLFVDGGASIGRALI